MSAQVRTKATNVTESRGVFASALIKVRRRVRAQPAPFGAIL